MGVMGGSILLNSSDLMFSLLSWGGIAFLTAYGAMSMRAALHYKSGQQQQLTNNKSLKMIVITSLMVTFLNPHAYVDTVMILGSVGGQYQGTSKLYFSLGAMSASIVWFFCLATSAAKLSRHLTKPKVKCTIDIIVALIMWLIAYSLFQSWLTQANGT